MKIFLFFSARIKRQQSSGKTAGIKEGKGFKKKKPAASYFPPERSIIGAGVLDFRVRNGNGYIHPTMATGIIIKCQ